MPAFDHHDPTECFNPEQIEMMLRVIDRAWDVIRHDESAEKETEARSLLSLCVLSEARTGEDNYTRLVNRSIAAFRRQRALLLPERRSA
jgi:hypothetical protein